MEAETQMGPISVSTVTTKYNQLMNTVTMGGNVVQKQIFNGEKGVNAGMAGEAPMSVQEITRFQESAYPFSQLYYAEKEFELNLSGIEMVNGTKAYRIDIKTPGGNEMTEYYAVETSLKVREVSKTPQGTITQDYADYKELDGIKVPHEMVMSGAMPVPLKMKLLSAKFNIVIEKGTFSLD